ncbi:GPI transamidase component PIG-T [Armadillidium nasatum]|uniref:GPI transamidase component PIG-T n=1 Tax=Armadillidium nasatum TaxID=96803 RepID=A0A5N5TJH1_9CRUS|nr:GPI transamidase component PIG-T [Armadillidium nasatum]
MNVIGIRMRPETLFYFNIIFVVNCFQLIIGSVEDYNNAFSEELLIRPLPSGHVYSHFEFTTLWTNKRIKESILNYKDFDFVHYDLFPRAFGEIVERYHVRELHLSLTQGLWRYHKWGYPVVEAPPGAQLWTWKDLVNALSGLFCASLNFIDSTNTVSPELSFRPLGITNPSYSQNSSLMRYTALPRENVCTENLTPWKKLLPCDTKSGLSTLLHPTPLYSAYYHSLSLHMRPICEDKDCRTPVLELVQSLSLVQKLFNEMDGRQDWTLRSLFSAPLISVCPLSKISKIYVDITENENLEIFKLDPLPPNVETQGEGTAKRSLAIYDNLMLVKDGPFNLQARYPNKHIYGIIPVPSLQVSRFITGHGLERGSIRSITVKLVNSCPNQLTVTYLEVLPWYLRLFFHTSHFLLPESSMYVSKLVTARDRERGWLYEVVVTLPPHSTTEMQLEFGRALLKWLEYPPDANHGFYIPSALTMKKLESKSFLGMKIIDKLKSKFLKKKSKEEESKEELSQKPSEDPKDKDKDEDRGGGEENKKGITLRKRVKEVHSIKDLAIYSLAV